MCQGFNHTKEIPKYSKENMPVERFGSDFSQNGTINSISKQDCHILNDLSVDTHIGNSQSHMTIWVYDHIAM